MLFTCPYIYPVPPLPRPVPPQVITIRNRVFGFYAATNKIITLRLPIISRMFVFKKAEADKQSAKVAGVSIRQLNKWA